METLYKALSDAGLSINGEQEGWGLPQGGHPGSWLPPVKGQLAEANGYHLYRARDLLTWLGPAIYEAEWRGEQLATEKDVIVREARLVRRIPTWNEEAARDFAAACADHVLPFFERVQPCDNRPRRAIETARLFAHGLATVEELTAAWSAARNVMTADLATVSGDALDVARAAVMSDAVGSEWTTAAAAEDTARAAREAVARAVTRAAARDDWGTTDPAEGRTLHDAMAAAWAWAEAEERAWQTERLLAYLAPEQIRRIDLELIV